MKDVALYGNLTYDRVFSENLSYETVGGVANVWRQLRSKPNISVGLSPTSIGEAIIIVDEEQGERTSNSLMTQKIVTPEIIPAKWNHIAYLDHLPVNGFLSSLEGIISADVCGNGQLEEDILKNIDLIFIGDGDGIDCLDIVDSGVKYIVYHTPDEITLIPNKKNAITIKVEKVISKVNVLGAGDMFAAELIRNMKNMELNGDNLVRAIEISQKEISKILESSK